MAQRSNIPSSEYYRNGINTLNSTVRTSCDLRYCPFSWYLRTVCWRRLWKFSVHSWFNLFPTKQMVLIVPDKLSVESWLGMWGIHHSTTNRYHCRWMGSMRRWRLDWTQSLCCRIRLLCPKCVLLSGETLFPLFSLYSHSSPSSVVQWTTARQVRIVVKLSWTISVSYLGWACTAVIVATTLAPVAPVVLPAYSKCNGVGTAICAPGTGCFRTNAAYSECRPYCPATWACETDLAGPNEQCGGMNSKTDLLSNADVSFS